MKPTGFVICTKNALIVRLKQQTFKIKHQNSVHVIETPCGENNSLLFLNNGLML